MLAAADASLAIGLELILKIIHLSGGSVMCECANPVERSQHNFLANTFLRNTSRKVTN